MHDGMIVQSGKYQDLLQPGSVFEALVAAHTEAMEMVESEQLYDPVHEQIQLQRKLSRKMSSSAPHAGHAEENLAMQVLAQNSLKASVIGIPSGIDLNLPNLVAGV